MSNNTPLAYLKIAFTGTFHKRRSDVERDAVLAGAQVHDRVKRDTSWLVVAKRPGRKKQEAAQRFGVRVVSEDVFLAELSGDKGADAPEVVEPKPTPCLDWVDGIDGERCVKF